MSRRLACSLAAVAALVAAPRPAAAGSSSANLDVTATVLGSCTIAPAAIAFGDYDPSATTDRDAPATDITVRCTNGTRFTIALGTGSNASGTTRRMSGGGAGSVDNLTYELYSDSTHNTAWATTTERTASIPGAGPNAYTVQVWGRIPHGQAVSTGSYADSVLMTVNF